MNFYYINSKNERINFYEYPYFFQEGDLLDYKYSYTKQTGKRRNKIRNITNDVKEKKIKIAVIPNKGLALYEREDEFAKAVNNLVDILDYDVVNDSLGRLYSTTGYYLECMILGSSKADWKIAEPFMFNELTVVVPNPKWIKEVTCAFEIQTEEYEDGLDYPFDYPFDYTPSGISYVVWDTRHYAPSDFKLYVYGPCTNPLVSINGYPYQVFTTLAANEYFVLDSKEHLITKYLANGTTSSLYNSRQFVPTVFEKIPGGVINVSWSGDFRFNITLFMERSEPQWYEKQPVYLIAADGSRLVTEAGEYIILQRKE